MFFIDSLVLWRMSEWVFSEVKDVLKWIEDYFNVVGVIIVDRDGE